MMSVGQTGTEAMSGLSGTDRLQRPCRVLVGQTGNRGHVGS